MSESPDSLVAEGSHTEEAVQVYLTEVGRVPALDAAEELHCFEHVRAGDDKADSSRKRLIEANLYRVVALAKAQQTPHLDLLDLIEAGNRGLLRAASSLENCAHNSFWPYAEQFVESSLADATTRPAVPSTKPF